MNDSVNSVKQSPADEPIKLPTMITVVGTVLVVGSIINIFAASVALRFPIYLYCDPSDYLKITPVWGYVSLGYVLSFVYGTVRGFFRTRNAPLRSPAESACRKREDQNIALLATALFGLEILGYIFLPSTRYVSATAIQFTSAIVAQLWIIRLYHESKFPWYLGSFKVFALGLMAQVLVLAWFN